MRRALVIGLLLAGGAGCPPKGVDQARTGVEAQNVSPGLAAPALAGMRLTVETYPKVDGSPSTHVLNLLMAAKALGVAHEWAEASKWNAYSRTLRIEGVKRDEPSPADAARRFVRNELQNTGTDQAYRKLLAGEADLILVTRGPIAGELKTARDRGIELDAQVVGLDALAFAVNQTNPVSNLRLGHVREVYDGAISNWREVGGNDEPIVALRREPNSISEEMMRGLVMRGRTMPPVTREMLADSTIGPVGKLAKETGGLAYSAYPYVRHRPDGVGWKLLAVDGVMPTPQTLRGRNYPLVSEIYIVTKKTAGIPTAAQKLRAWLLSDEGQRVVEEAGFVPRR